MLTFIVPVRHPLNSPDWSRAMEYLSQMVRSIAMQKSPEWQAVVVANEGAPLPVLPKQVDVVRVDYPPNPLHARGTADKETFRDAFRLDKGRRVLAGMLHAKPAGHVMVVDDDDLVSDRLAGFVADHADSHGWYISEGYLWSDEGRLLFRHSRFSTLCGTSHIVRADLYGLPNHPDEASDGYVKQMLGSHVYIHDHLERAGTPLAPLPFPGAVYRMGHAGAHSQSSGLLRTVILNKRVARSPLTLIGNVLRMRPLTKALQAEFFHA